MTEPARRVPPSFPDNAPRLPWLSGNLARPTPGRASLSPPKQSFLGVSRRPTEQRGAIGAWARGDHRLPQIALSASPFLSEQEPTKFLAQVRSGGRGFLHFSPVPAEAASGGQRRTMAKSLPPPFVQVNHVAHALRSLVLVSHTEHRSEAFHEAALNEIAQWHDGELGGHMDEPSSAATARKALGKRHDR